MFVARKEVELKIIDLLDGREDRIAVSAWARQGLVDRSAIADDATLKALEALSKADKKNAEYDDYVFENEEIRAWLEALRASPPEQFPARSAVERKLTDLLEGRISRSEAAAWAWPLVADNQPRVTDFAAWDALTSISMCDGKHPDGTCMYDKVSFRAWLEQLRAAPVKASGK